MNLWHKSKSWLRIKAAEALGLSDLQHPTAWLTNWSGGGRTRAGLFVSPDSAMTLSTYYACLRNISEDIAKMPLIVYRRLDPRGKMRMPDDPRYTLLHTTPNPDMTAMTFRETLTHYALAWGNGYAELERSPDGREVVALWPIHPSRVTVRWSQELNQVVYDVYGSITLEGKLTTVPQRLRQGAMLHLKGLGSDGYQGYSVFALAAEALGLALAAQTFGASFFGNNASLGGVLEHPAHLSEEAQRNLRTSWREAYTGPEAAGNIAILEEGMKFTRLGVPPEEAQYLQTRQFQVADICRWFRMPPHKVQDLDRGTWGNIEQQNLEYVTDTLTPWCVRWEQELKRKMFPEPDVFAEHLMLGLLRGDQASRATYYKSRFELGTLSPDDIRELENENPLPDDLGDHYFIAANNYAPLEAVVGAQAMAEDEEGAMPAFPIQPGGTNGHREDE